MPLNHTSEFINGPEAHKEVSDWIEHILKKYIDSTDRFAITLTKSEYKPFYIGPFTGKQDNQVLDIKADVGDPWFGKLPSVEVAYKDIDEIKYD